MSVRSVSVSNLAAFAMILLLASPESAGQGSFVYLRSGDELEWIKDPAVDGGSRAPLLGDSGHIARDAVAMLRWSPGAMIALHGHKGHACHGVILEGTVVVTTCDQRKELPAGSFFFIGGETLHAFQCAQSGACRIYMTEPNAKEFAKDGCPEGSHFGLLQHKK
jgi:mannose-6-phosphate isomerase-like protein (cupin superfamily)